MKSQKEVISKQEVVISKQGDKVELLEDRVDEVQEDLNTSRKISIGSILLTILLIL